MEAGAGCLQITLGQKVTLRWKVSGATQVRLNGKRLADDARELEDEPLVGTWYTLLCTNAVGAQEATFFVDVIMPEDMVSAPAVVDRKRVDLFGSFSSGGGPAGGKRFLLRQGDPKAAPLGPADLHGARTANLCRAGVWEADAQGRYRFEGLPSGRYFVEALPLEAAPRGIPGELPDVDDAGADEAADGPRALVWAQLFDQDEVAPVANADYQIEGTALRGRTDAAGVLRHEVADTGFLVVRCKGGVGTAPALPAGESERLTVVRLRGVAAPEGA